DPPSRGTILSNPSDFAHPLARIGGRRCASTMRELRILKPVAKLEEAAWLDPVVHTVKKAVDGVVRPRGLRDLLHGVPTGHPLHPILILLPAGAWTSVAVLDLVPGAGRAARTLVGFGLLAA